MISVCTTLYHSENTIDAFIKRICNVLAEVQMQFEIVIVDDGSPDHSSGVVRELMKTTKGIRLVELSRNFGHHKALKTAIEFAKGDWIFLIDSDLEEQPELLRSFIEMKNANPQHDVYYGVAQGRKGKAIERIGGGLFWKLFVLLSSTSVTPNSSTVRLMSRRYVNAFLQANEQDFFIDGIAEYMGFSKLEIPFKKESKGETSYTPSKRLKLAVNAITSFSTVPLKVIFYTGASVFFVALFITVITVIKFFIVGIPVEGWTSLILSIWMLGGLQLMMMGVIGIYLARVFNEVKRRPFVVVKEIFES